MRPRGEVRVALAEAVQRLVEPGGGVDYRTAAAEAKVGYLTAEVTLRNMARSGELAIVGREKAAGSQHWRALYAPADTGEPLPQAWGGIENMAQVMRTFAAPVDDTTTA